MTAFLTPTQAAARPGGPTRAQVCALARLGRIPGAIRAGHAWLIPATWQYTRRPGGWKLGRKRKPAEPDFKPEAAETA